MEIITCQRCKKEIKSTYKGRKYCSRECYGKAIWGEMSRIIPTSCFRCGKQMSVYKSRYGTRKFCSLTCARLGPSEKIDVSHISKPFGNWLAGFIDGEGSFLLIINYSRYVIPRFHIGLRIDDKAIIKKIHQKCGFGTSIRQKGSYDSRYGNHANPQSFFTIDNINDCLKLVALLEKYPLRAKKKRDFLIWAEAVKEKSKGNAADRTKLLKLAHDIREVRKFKMP